MSSWQLSTKTTVKLGVELHYDHHFVREEEPGDDPVDIIDAPRVRRGQLLALGMKETGESLLRLRLPSESRDSLLNVGSVPKITF